MNVQSVQYILIPILLFLLIILLSIRSSEKAREKARKELKEKIEGLANNTLELTPEEFFNFRNFSFGGRGRAHVSAQYNFAGVYILFNKTKNMYYIGQGKQVFNRVNNHFTGKGNGDVYADYKYGDSFSIRMISLENSGFSSLNDLERQTISTYNAYSAGYNKTRGNLSQSTARSVPRE
jgi:hypothetical protein